MAGKRQGCITTIEVVDSSNQPKTASKNAAKVPDHGMTAP
jgi:hypothetical protein